MLGGSISDTANLFGSQSATGTIGFFAYGPNDSTCSGNPAFTSFVDVQGDNQYSSGPFTPAAAGTYHFIASYGGDFTNSYRYCHTDGHSGAGSQPLDACARGDGRQGCDWRLYHHQ